MTLIHSRIAKRMGLKINKKGGEIYDLFDAQGNEMGVDGTCIIYVIPEGCSKPRTLKCLATPSLEEEEVLLGWRDMVGWGILKRDFNILSDEDMQVNQSSDVKRTKTSVEKNPPATPDAKVCPPNPISVIGKVAADISGHLTDGTSGQGCGWRTGSAEELAYERV